MLLPIRSLVLLVLCLVGVGLYRGWFSFSQPAQDPQNHKVNLSVSVDTQRLKADAELVKEKIAEKVAERVHISDAAAEKQSLR